MNGLRLIQTSERLELLISDDSDWQLFDEIGAALQQEFLGLWLSKVDGLDQRYWDLGSAKGARVELNISGKILSLASLARYRSCQPLCNKEWPMGTMTADQIRAYVSNAFLEPARRAGKSDVVIVARDVHADLKLDNRMPAICAALDAQKFQEQYGVILSARSGPKQGSTATWRFSIKP